MTPGVSSKTKPKMPTEAPTPTPCWGVSTKIQAYVYRKLYRINAARVDLRQGLVLKVVVQIIVGYQYRSHGWRGLDERPIV